MELKLINKLLASMLLVFIGGCSSSAIDDDGMLTNNEVPVFTTPSIVNGYYLSAETTSFPSNSPSKRNAYVLDSDSKTLSRYTERSNNEVQIDVVYEYSDAGTDCRKKRILMQMERLCKRLLLPMMTRAGLPLINRLTAIFRF